MAADAVVPTHRLILSVDFHAVLFLVDLAEVWFELETEGSDSGAIGAILTNALTIKNVITLLFFVYNIFYNIDYIILAL